MFLWQEEEKIDPNLTFLCLRRLVSDGMSTLDSMLKSVMVAAIAPIELIAAKIYHRISVKRTN